ncbi:J domain-containing protein [Actinoallomurus purpureus]|uniref:J domain-containing protein n=1 Tax=Actinoallomurus purpureus TaxID=478114 RepID=UPI0020928127|nr:J domain-containing protein [Actinoallomurus purpureus]MCO6008240.1 J domain-containing protein [Actinoallomurus purpureus]
MSADFAELAGHDAYDVLGVGQDATREEIRRAFRTLAKANHPDLFREPRAKAEAEENIRLLNAARDALQHRRAAYDAFRSAPPEPEAEPEELIDDPWADAAPGTPPSQDPWANADPGPALFPDPWDTADVGPPPPPPPVPVPRPPRMDAPAPPFVPPSVRPRRLLRRLIGIVFCLVWFGGILHIVRSALTDHGPQPSAAVPSSFAGTWKGLVKDVADKNREAKGWKAQVTLHAGKHNGDVHYLESGCGGTAVPVSFERDRLTVRTVFSNGTTGCDVGDMHLTLRKNGRLALAYYDKNGKTISSGVLTRR